MNHWVVLRIAAPMSSSPEYDAVSDNRGSNTVFAGVWLPLFIGQARTSPIAILEVCNPLTEAGLPRPEFSEMELQSLDTLSFVGSAALHRCRMFQEALRADVHGGCALAVTRRLTAETRTGAIVSAAIAATRELTGCDEVNFFLVDHPGRALVPLVPEQASQALDARQDMLQAWCQQQDAASDAIQHVKGAGKTGAAGSELDGAGARAEARGPAAAPPSPVVRGGHGVDLRLRASRGADTSAGGHAALSSPTLGPRRRSAEDASALGTARTQVVAAVERALRCGVRPHIRTLPSGAGILGHVVRTGCTVVTGVASDHPLYDAAVDAAFVTPVEGNTAARHAAAIADSGIIDDLRGSFPSGDLAASATLAGIGISLHTADGSDAGLVGDLTSPVAALGAFGSASSAANSTAAFREAATDCSRQASSPGAHATGVVPGGEVLFASAMRVGAANAGDARRPPPHTSPASGSSTALSLSPLSQDGEPPAAPARQRRVSAGEPPKHRVPASSATSQSPPSRRGPPPDAADLSSQLPVLTGTASAFGSLAAESRQRGGSAASSVTVAVRDSAGNVIGVLQALNKRYGASAPDAALRVATAPARLLHAADTARSHPSTPALYSSHAAGSVSSSSSAGSAREGGSMINKHAALVPISDADASLTEAIAASAGLCLEKASLMHASLRAQSTTESILRVVRATAQGATTDFFVCVDRILAEAQRAIRAERVSLLLVDAPRDELWVAVSGDIEGQRLPLQSGLAGQVVRSKRGVLVSNAYLHPRFNRDVDAETGFQTQSVLALPVQDHGGRVVGVLMCLNKRASSTAAQAVSDAIAATIGARIRPAPACPARFPAAAYGSSGQGGADPTRAGAYVAGDDDPDSDSYLLDIDVDDGRVAPIKLPRQPKHRSHAAGSSSSSDETAERGGARSPRGLGASSPGVVAPSTAAAHSTEAPSTGDEPGDALTRSRATSQPAKASTTNLQTCGNQFGGAATVGHSKRALVAMASLTSIARGAGRHPCFSLDDVALLRGCCLEISHALRRSSMELLMVRGRRVTSTGTRHSLSSSSPHYSAGTSSMTVDGTGTGAAAAATAAVSAAAAGLNDGHGGRASSVRSSEMSSGLGSPSDRSPGSAVSAPRLATRSLERGSTVASLGGHAQPDLSPAPSAVQKQDSNVSSIADGDTASLAAWQTAGDSESDSMAESQGGRGNDTRSQGDGAVTCATGTAVAPSQKAASDTMCTLESSSGCSSDSDTDPELVRASLVARTRLHYSSRTDPNMAAMAKGGEGMLVAGPAVTPSPPGALAAGRHSDERDVAGTAVTTDRVTMSPANLVETPSPSVHDGRGSGLRVGFMADQIAAGVVPRLTVDGRDRSPSLEALRLGRSGSALARHASVDPRWFGRLQQTRQPHMKNQTREPQRRQSGRPRLGSARTAMGRSVGSGLLSPSSRSQTKLGSDRARRMQSFLASYSADLSAEIEASMGLSRSKSHRHSHSNVRHRGGAGSVSLSSHALGQEHVGKGGATRSSSGLSLAVPLRPPPRRSSSSSRDLGSFGGSENVSPPLPLPMSMFTSPTTDGRPMPAAGGQGNRARIPSRPAGNVIGLESSTLPALVHHGRLDSVSEAASMTDAAVLEEVRSGLECAPGDATGVARDSRPGQLHAPTLTTSDEAVPLTVGNAPPASSSAWHGGDDVELSRGRLAQQPVWPIGLPGRIVDSDVAEIGTASQLHQLAGNTLTGGTTGTTAAAAILSTRGLPVAADGSSDQVAHSDGRSRQRNGALVAVAPASGAQLSEMSALAAAASTPKRLLPDQRPLLLPPGTWAMVANVCEDESILFSSLTPRRRVLAPAVEAVPYAGLEGLPAAPMDVPQLAAATPWLAAPLGVTACDVAGAAVSSALAIARPLPPEPLPRWISVEPSSAIAELPLKATGPGAALFDDSHPLRVPLGISYTGWAFDPFTVEAHEAGPLVLRFLWELGAVDVYDMACWSGAPQSLAYGAASLTNPAVSPDDASPAFGDSNPGPGNSTPSAGTDAAGAGAIFEADPAAAGAAERDMSDTAGMAAGDAALLLDCPTILAFVEAVRRRYRDNAFHSFFHGLHVCQAAAVLARDTGLSVAASPLDLASLVLAALAHDVDHPAVNNDFMMRSESPLALRYNDQSVLENHHTSTMFAILHRPETAVIASLSVKQQRRFRRLAVQSILATDMARHFTLIESIKALDEPIQPGADDKAVASLAEIVLHAADVSGQVQPWRLASRWSDLVAEEFAAQVRREEACGLDPTPFMMNLHTLPARAELQSSFCAYVLLPMWRPLAEVYPQLNPCAARIEKNQGRYKAVLQQVKEDDQQQEREEEEAAQHAATEAEETEKEVESAQLPAGGGSRGD